MLLEHRVCIVSGIGPGMGQAIAKALAREGADVVLAGRTQQRLDELAAELAPFGRRVLPLVTDITDTASCRRLVERTTTELGGIDVLVNNAYHPGTYERIEAVDFETWRAPFEVNVLGTMRLSQAVVPAMKERGGAIVMINSMSMRRMMERFGGYAASKAALLAATQTLALELGRYKIRVNSVVPGYIWGPALQGYFVSEAAKYGITAQQMYDRVAAETALGHIPTSEEIAESVVFFASEMARTITGQTLDVNAGHFFG